LTDLTRVGVVGLGNIGRIHIGAFAQIPDAEIVALCDLDSKIAAEVSEELESAPKVYSQLKEMLIEPEIDLISICLPSGSHVDAAKMVIEAGKHVVIEKPLDVDLSKARELVQIADANPSVSVSIISQHRFDPSTVKAMELAQSKALGQLTTAIASVAWWRSQAYYDSASWRGTWAEDGGGALMNQGIHTLDLMLAVMGKPVTVSGKAATLAHERIEVEDALVATIEFENGKLAVLHASTCAYPGIETSLQIMGTNGSLRIVNDELDYLHVYDASTPAGDFGLNGLGNQLQSGFQAQNHKEATQNVEPHKRQLSSTIASIQEGTPASVTPSEAFLSMATVRAIYISSQINERVSVDDVVRGDYDSLEISVEAH